VDCVTDVDITPNMANTARAVKINGRTCVLVKDRQERSGDAFSSPGTWTTVVCECDEKRKVER
jgi:hypothetical protein